MVGISHVKTSDVEVANSANHGAKSSHRKKGLPLKGFGKYLQGGNLIM